MKIKSAISVSQLTAYEKRRLNKNRNCVVCGQRIADFQTIDMVKLRDQREVLYQFYHHHCAVVNGYIHEGDD